VDATDRHPLLDRALTRGELIGLDCLVAVSYTLVLFSFAIGGPGHAPSLAPLWARSLVVAGIGLPLAGRRVWPRAVFAVVFVASVVSAAAGVVSDSFVGAAFALYAVALTRPRKRWEPTLVIGALSAVAALGTALAGPRDVPWTAVPLDCALLGGAWTVGRAVRERRAYAARTADQVRTEERLRIARELHDIVAHSMGLIAVKAGVANHVLAVRPEEAQDALRVIESTSRSALAEMRHLLGVLRSGTETGDPPASLAPPPGVGGLRHLAERAELAGGRVSMELRGLDRVPEGVGLSVYRIVQEALTNVVRHASPARCDVAVEAEDRLVRIEVTDDGPGHRVLPADPKPGHGLLGMSERVAVYGGVFQAGPRPEGGFRVSILLPYEPAPVPSEPR